MSQCSQMSDLLSLCQVFYQFLLMSVMSFQQASSLIEISSLIFQPENVMLLTRKHQQIKLIDFGLSKRIDPGQEQRHMLGKTIVTDSWHQKCGKWDPL